MNTFTPIARPAVARTLPYGRLSPASWLLAVLGVASVAIALTVGLKGGDIGYELLQRYHVDLIGFAYGQPLLAASLFVFAVSLAVATSLPGASVLAVLGGMLFGSLEATIYVQLASLAGAAAVFLLARNALASTVRAHAGTRIGRLTDGFNRNAFSYVALMHLVPVLPFGMIIALPAVCGVRLRTYLIAAFLGLLPITVMLANLGEGLSTAFFREGGVTLASLLSPQILLAVAGLAGLALLPVFYRWLTRREIA